MSNELTRYGQRIGDKWHKPSIDTKNLVVTDWTETIENGRFNIMINIKINPDGSVAEVTNSRETNPMHTPKYSMVCPHCKEPFNFEEEHVGMEVWHTPDPDYGVCGGLVTLIPNPDIYEDSWMWVRDLYENTKRRIEIGLKNTTEA